MAELQKAIRKSVNMNAQEADELAAYAETIGVSESWVLRKALREFLDRNPGLQLKLPNIRNG